MPDAADPETHLPLQAHVLQILMSVLDKELHGYSIIQDIAARTEGDMLLATSTVYAAIKRMMKAGLLEETEGPADAQSIDVRRRYYRASPLGRAVAREEARRIGRLNRMVVEGGLLDADEMPESVT